MSIQHEQQQDPEDTSASENNLDLPPFVKTWKQFYLLLVGWLIFLIAAFYLFTKYFQ
ncbi:MAG: hypothetical protein ABWY16_04465 [Pedobacter sp.]|jgi:hypothetical protein|uniref:hypothetical protein n=1 Tax=Pedobacter sp. TaxID=1411316 RepID=UPI003393D867